MSLQPDSIKQLIQQRLNFLYFALAIIFFVLAARLWQLQIIQGNQYTLLAERNRVRTLPLVAPRGTIADRNNVPLVENRPSFNLLLYRELMKDPGATVRFITEKLQMKPEELAARLRRAKGTSPYRPIVIKEDVGIDDISVVESHRREHPEIQLGPEPRRLYRYGRLAAHVLGYVGEVSEEEISGDVFAKAKTGDLVGKSGVERIYNQYLTGVDGSRRVLADSLGREVGLLEEVESVIGGELQLTLDLNLQMVADKLLEDKVGAIVAMDPRNGEILAMSSAPPFDPNSFSTRISEHDWNMLITDPNRPLQNRAIQNSYSPGSIFKIIMAEAGLEEGFVEDNTHVYCTGSTVLYDRLFHCHQRKGHGFVDLDRAITNSCNIFFYSLGKRMGISKIAEHAQELGLGGRTGIDLPGERTGLVPTPEWKEEVRGAKWFAGETISVSIGQGPVSTTPLQLLRAVSAIATKGGMATPHVLLRVDRHDKEIPTQWQTHQLNLDSDATERIRKGMWGVVNKGGTGGRAMIPGLDICGKTGTVQLISSERIKDIKQDPSSMEDHSWFIGFASLDNPEIAVVVFLEHGGRGGIFAAPLAREIFQTYYAKKHRPEGDSRLAQQIAEVRR